MGIGVNVLNLFVVDERPNFSPRKLFCEFMLELSCLGFIGANKKYSSLDMPIKFENMMSHVPYVFPLNGVYSEHTQHSFLIGRRRTEL